MKKALATIKHIAYGGYTADSKVFAPQAALVSVDRKLLRSRHKPYTNRSLPLEKKRTSKTHNHSFFHN